MKADIRRDSKTRAWFGTFEYEAGVDPALKPCPFCGEANAFDVFGVSENAHYFVRCASCGSENGGAGSSRFSKRTRATFEAAHREGFAQGIAAWNRRAGAA